jgi:glycerol-3-phosphate dehydrogenase
MAVLLARGGLEVQLGTRSGVQAEQMDEARVNERYLPDVRLPDSVRVKRGTEIELAGLDLICLAVPTAALPQAVGQIADKVGERTAILLLSKGLVAPQGELPSEYVGERVHARALACLGGPAHAREAVSGSAALVLGSEDPDLRAQLGEVFDRAGLVCERSGDVLGVEMAGAAKNAAALAAAAAQSHGLNAAGIAAGEIWRECVEYATGRGARLETFVGLAGVGDLTATVLAPGSRNRRAGEMLGAGMPADAIRAEIGQTSEGLDSVPLIAETIAASGVEAEGLEGLADLVKGKIGPDEWIAGLRRTERARRAA